jgi:hypothetical protein
LRGISYSGFSRDTVGAGFVGEILARGQRAEIELKHTTRDEAKVEEMERDTREALRHANYQDCYNDQDH